MPEEFVGQLSIRQLYQLWIEAGGNPKYAVPAISVAEAESSGNVDAHSPSDDWGVWQINGSNFARFGVNSRTVLDPLTNARIAVSMSGGGQNWAAWCTAWANPARNCGHGFLANPQPGSAAYPHMAQVASQLGTVPPTGGTPTAPAAKVLHGDMANKFSGGASHRVNVGWQRVRSFTSSDAPKLWKGFDDQLKRIRKMKK